MSSENQNNLELEKSLKDSIESLKKWQYGNPEGDLSIVRKAVLDSPLNREKAKILAQALIPILESDATKDAKEFVCRQLMMLNSDESVVPLSRLLQNDELTDMALYALESLSAHAVNRVLLAQLSQAKGRIQVGIINVLGRRKVPQAVNFLSSLLQEADKDLQQATIRALGMIGGLDAVKALMPLWNKSDEKIRMTLGDALLSCAETLKGETGGNAAIRLLNILSQENSPEPIRKAALRKLQSP